ncbi:MAG: VOC family protein [Defluviitaleaceae bacterium]|nr:VOC family protein [Defluviitaleaceae bacterium]
MIKTYLMFNGNCMEAMERYVSIFKGKVNFAMKYPDNSDKVYHAELDILGSTILCCDSEEESVNNNMFISICLKADELQKAWDALAEGGKIRYDLQPADFTELHGSLKDKYGVNWMFSAEH